MENQSEEKKEETTGVVVSSKKQPVRIPTRPQRSKKEEEENMEDSETNRQLAQQLSVLEILNQKVMNVETELANANLPETKELLNEISNFSQYYNDLTGKINAVMVQLQKEVSYTRNLETQIKLKKSEAEILELKRVLEEDREKVSLSLEKIELALKDGLDAMELQEQTNLSSIQDQLTAFNKSLTELTKMDQTVKECVETFRESMVDAHEREYNGLKADCKKLLDEYALKMEALKNDAVSFLKTCEKQNQELIKKIPKQSDKLCLKDILIYGLCGLNLLGWIFMVV